MLLLIWYNNVQTEGSVARVLETKGVCMLQMSRKAIACGIALLVSSYAIADTTMYVSPDGDDSDGKTWETAYKHPQTAVDNATGLPDDVTTIWVGEGIYEDVERDGYFNALRVTKSNLHIIATGNREDTVLKGYKATPSKDEKSSRGLMINPSLENVLVSGFAVKYGGNKYNTQDGPTYATSVIAASGVISNCAVHTYYRSRTPTIYLYGTAQMKDCLIDGLESASRSPNAGYNSIVYMVGSALLENCSIRDIAWLNNTGNCQAVYLASADAIVRGCLIVGNQYGIMGGTTSKGAGVYASAGLIESCTIYGNKVYGNGGGVYIDGNNVTLRNCIVWGNTATVAAGGDDIYIAAGKNPTIEYCNSSDLTPDELITHNMSADPLFVDASNNDYALSLRSPCVGKGLKQPWMSGALDLLGGDRIITGTVSMGALEPQERYRGLSVSIGTTSGKPTGRNRVVVGFASSVAGAEKNECEFLWDFGDGETSKLPDPQHSYDTVGTYTVKLIVSKEGMDDGFAEIPDYVVVAGDVAYVSTDGSDQPPYDTWEKAARDISKAIAVGPLEVLVTNGTYVLDYSEGDDGLRVQKAVRVRSVEGPAKTAITSGYASDPGPIKDFRRILTVSHDQAAVEGFALLGALPPAVVADKGLVANCIISNFFSMGDVAFNEIKGSAILSNCLVDASSAVLRHINASATLVEASGDAQIVGCEVRNFFLNRQDAGTRARRGGIVASDRVNVRNCYVHDLRWSTREECANGNAGIILLGQAVADNCTVINCWSRYNPEGGLRAANGTTVRNCIFYGNTGGDPAEPIDVEPNLLPSVFHNCLVGAGSLPSIAIGCDNLKGKDPMLVDGYRLAKNSPCENAGEKLDWCAKKGMAVDIDGQERRCGGSPDVGCWEMQRDFGLILLLR